MSSEFRLENYLVRIGFGGTIGPDLATLAAIHAAHVKRSPSRVSIHCCAAQLNSILPRSTKKSSMVDAADIVSNRIRCSKARLRQSASTSLGWGASALDVAARKSARSEDAHDA
jgi:hypothetical protein